MRTIIQIVLRFTTASDQYKLVAGLFLQLCCLGPGNPFDRTMATEYTLL